MSAIEWDRENHDGSVDTLQRKEEMKRKEDEAQEAKTKSKGWNDKRMKRITSAFSSCGWRSRAVWICHVPGRALPLAHPADKIGAVSALRAHAAVTANAAVHAAFWNRVSAQGAETFQLLAVQKVPP